MTKVSSQSPSSLLMPVAQKNEGSPKSSAIGMLVPGVGSAGFDAGGSGFTSAFARHKVNQVRCPNLAACQTIYGKVPERSSVAATHSRCGYPPGELNAKKALMCS